MSLFQVATILLFLVTHPVSAAILTVTNLNDNGPGSLRDTIAAADSGDTIVFSITGTISLTTGELVISKNLIVDGPGATSLIVERIAVGAPLSRVFNVTSGTVTISDLTVQRGFPQVDGGGIKNEGTLTLNRCTIANNSTRIGDGGGIYNSGTLILNDCAVDRNRAALESMSFGSGGGIYNEDSLTLNNCSFFNNLAPSSSGGAVSNEGNLNVNSCSFSFNNALSGGAIDNNATATVVNTTFTGNDAFNGGGGAIYSFALTDVTLTVEDCLFTGNEAQGNAGSGGAIASGANSAEATTSITRCTFKDNRANVRGGAISNSGNTTFGGNPTMNLSLINCTLVQNIAGSGGAISNFNNGAAATNVEVRSCTLSRNGHSNGSGSGIINDAHAGGSASLTLGNTILQKNTGPGSVNLLVTNGGVTSQGYNLADDDGAGFLTGPGDQLNSDPKLDPAGLQNNGGPTQTFALIEGSPAIDRGNSLGLTTDQRGTPRPVDNPAVANFTDAADIGAYEAPADPLQDGSDGFVVTTADDHDDGICGATDCTLREAIARCNILPGPNAIGFSPALTGTITLKPSVGGQLVITDGVTILGPGARFLRISANTQTRVFHVSGTGSTTISRLTIADGRVDNFNAGDSEGGGIYNQATLALVDCTLDFNRALGGSGFMTGQNGGSARGGGVFNAGALTLERCTFKGNGAGGGSGAANPPQPMVLTTGGSAGDGWGGGVYNGNGASLSVINCTFSTNFVYGGNGGSGDFGGNGGHAFGGAIYNLGTLSVESSTLSLNSGDPGAGGAGSNPARNGAPGQGSGALARGAGTSTLRNTIVAGNTADAPVFDVSGAFTSGGFNLIGRADGSTGFNASTDQTGTNAAPLLAQLGALANNGGATDTMAPLPSSPAVDAGNAFGLTTDQRGVVRPVEIPGLPNAPGGDGSDIGAVELTPIFVTTVDDHNDGACTSGDCTLREAINLANARSGDDTIAFSPGVTGTIQLNSELPLVSTNMVIAGPGANLVTVRRNTGTAHRIFVVTNAPALGPNVTISGLTITNGLAPAGGTPIDSGGGILNDRSTLTVRDCAVIGNASNGGSFSHGGGIMNSEGTLTVDRCTFSANNAYYGGGIANRRVSLANVGLVTVSNSTFVANTGGYGNGIFNSAENSGRIATVNAMHCTFSGNSAPGSFGGGVYSGVANSATANIALSHCTFVGNDASQGTSIYSFNFNATASVTLRNNIFATSGAANLVNNGGSMTSLGYNLSNDAGAGILNSGTDLVNTDPLLAPLASNGGPTQTHALLAGSPAIDKGRSFSLLFDQRGLLRAADSPKIANAAGGDGADIGAFEVSPFGGIIDSDGDGMPDEYEVFFALNDPNADMDGDGDSNLEEYGNRTDPCDNASYLLRIISIERSGNDVVITFNGVAGRTFRLERKDELSDPTWLSIPGLPDLTPATTGNAQLTHIDGLSIDHSFYRVRLLP